MIKLKTILNESVTIESLEKFFKGQSYVFEVKRKYNDENTLYVHLDYEQDSNELYKIGTLAKKYDMSMEVIASSKGDRATLIKKF